MRAVCGCGCACERANTRCKCQQACSTRTPWVCKLVAHPHRSPRRSPDGVRGLETASDAPPRKAAHTSHSLRRPLHAPTLTNTRLQAEHTRSSPSSSLLAPPRVASVMLRRGAGAWRRRPRYPGCHTGGARAGGASEHARPAATAA
eukprot:126026-Rhodomonas_salina.1